MDKTAVLELKPNCIKLTIFNMNEAKFYKVLEVFSMPISLGETSEKDNMIKPPAAKEAIYYISRMQEIIQKYSIEKVFSFASSDLTGLVNVNSFLEEVLNSTSINFRTISLQDQAKIMHCSVIDSLDVPRGLIVSLEDEKATLISYSRKSILDVAHINFGAKTLNKLTEDKSPEERKKIIADAVTEELSKHDFIRNIDPDTRIVGMNEYFSSLGKLMRRATRYPFDKAHGYEATIEDFYKFNDFLKGFELDKTKKIKGIYQDRADYFLTGMAILNEMFAFMQVKDFIICEKGITNGLMLQSAPQPLERPIWDILTYSIRKNQSLYEPKSENAIHVCELSKRLFNHLKIVSRLPRHTSKALIVAANFYDCGRRIAYFNLPKNGFNIIMGMDLDGLSHKEHLLAAFICLCQDPDAFDLSTWLKYKSMLTDEDLIAVKKLGLMLSVCNKLDCRKNQVVKDLGCEILGDTVILKAVSAGKSDVTQFEINEASTLKEEVRKMFDKNLQII